MPDDDTPDEGGLEPAAEAEDVEVDAPEAEAVEAEPETYTREQLAELLPRFDRFAMHEGPEALKQYGQAYDAAASGYRQGAHLEPQPEDFYRRIGLDPNEVQAPEPEVEEAPGLWGSPWQVPTTWEEVQQYASSDDPNARRLAWIAVANEPSAPEDVKQAYFAHWAAIDQAGAAAYTQQATMTAAEARLAELEARMEEKYAAATQDLRSRNAANLLQLAAAEIPGFREHAAGVEELFNERCSIDPAFAERIMNSSTTEQQLKELRRLTIIAAAEAEPERKAKQKQATDETDAAKIRSRTETSRTNGAPEDEQSALKRKSLEDARKVGHRVM